MTTCSTRLRKRAKRSGTLLNWPRKRNKLLASAGEGSLQADVDATNDQFVQVVDGAAGLHRLLGNAISGVEKILHNLRVGPLGSDDSRGNRDSGRGDKDERASQLRKELPPPVQPRSGQKTHGRWFTGAAGEAESIVSGVDDMAAAAEQHLAGIGVPAVPITTSDVELKLAVHMAQQGIRDATVVINHMPCKGDFGCDTLVPVVLPEGSSLTVYGINRRGMTVKKT
ncbi:DddA-like double-stranded DNA deaminase toxin [Lentzea sp. NBRC 102530]|uniref:DddA-like double-stranded DNA deaminase toxin n=1 Tax=Lentzea sp. NBRC 102530 TaxID=3032201 RepID=UPI0024A56AA4|nr:DddA-like double-stranded DNA deaminase toxin [Lentzea sp. NBRC 102530]GLY47969.1 hypothetical protein Lesp01_16250 [Lentzea sp. NBRC 102530]